MKSANASILPFLPFLPFSPEYYWDVLRLSRDLSQLVSQSVVVKVESSHTSQSLVMKFKAVTRMLFNLFHGFLPTHKTLS